MTIGDDKPFDPAPLLRFKKVAIFGANYFADKLPPTKCWLVWDKKKGKPDQAADCELVWTNFNKPSRIFSHLWRGIVREGEENVSRGPKLHAHQKPVALLRRIIEYSDHQGLVIDAYSGSGSTACAAFDLGLPCISIELLMELCTLSRQRLKSRAGA